MDNFDLKKYLAEGRLYENNDSVGMINYTGVQKRKLTTKYHGRKSNSEKLASKSSIFKHLGFSARDCLARGQYKHVSFCAKY